MITLNCPEVLNAWNSAMRDMILSALDAAEQKDAIRTIMLTGAGDRAFGACQDLNEPKTFNSDRAELWIDEWERL